VFVAFVCLWREGACTDHMLLSAGIPAHSPDVFVHLRRAVCREECREDACFLFLASFRKFEGEKNKKSPKSLAESFYACYCEYEWEVT